MNVRQYLQGHHILGSLPLAVPAGKQYMPLLIGFEDTVAILGFKTNEENDAAPYNEQWTILCQPPISSFSRSGEEDFAQFAFARPKHSEQQEVLGVAVGCTKSGRVLTFIAREKKGETFDQSYQLTAFPLTKNLFQHHPSHVENNEQIIVHSIAVSLLGSPTTSVLCAVVLRCVSYDCDDRLLTFQLDLNQLSVDQRISEMIDDRYLSFFAQLADQSESLLGLHRSSSKELSAVGRNTLPKTVASLHWVEKSPPDKFLPTLVLQTVETDGSLETLSWFAIHYEMVGGKLCATSAIELQLCGSVQQANEEAKNFKLHSIIPATSGLNIVEQSLSLSKVVSFVKLLFGVEPAKPPVMQRMTFSCERQTVTVPEMHGGSASPAGNHVSLVPIYGWRDDDPIFVAQWEGYPSQLMLYSGRDTKLSKAIHYVSIQDEEESIPFDVSQFSRCLCWQFAEETLALMFLPHANADGEIQTIFVPHFYEFSNQTPALLQGICHDCIPTIAPFPLSNCAALITFNMSEPQTALIVRKVQAPQPAKQLNKCQLSFSEAVYGRMRVKLAASSPPNTLPLATKALCQLFLLKVTSAMSLLVAPTACIGHGEQPLVLQISNSVVEQNITALQEVWQSAAEAIASFPQRVSNFNGNQDELLFCGRFPAVNAGDRNIFLALWKSSVFVLFSMDDIVENEAPSVTSTVHQCGWISMAMGASSDQILGGENLSLVHPISSVTVGTDLSCVIDMKGRTMCFVAAGHEATYCVQAFGSAVDMNRQVSAAAISSWFGRNTPHKGCVLLTTACWNGSFSFWTLSSNQALPSLQLLNETHSNPAQEGVVLQLVLMESVENSSTLIGVVALSSSGRIHLSQFYFDTMCNFDSTFKVSCRIIDTGSTASEVHFQSMVCLPLSSSSYSIFLLRSRENVHSETKSKSAHALSTLVIQARAEQSSQENRQFSVELEPFVGPLETCNVSALGFLHTQMDPKLLFWSNPDGTFHIGTLHQQKELSQKVVFCQERRIATAIPIHLEADPVLATEQPCSLCFQTLTAISMTNKWICIGGTTEREDGFTAVGVGFYDNSIDRMSRHQVNFIPLPFLVRVNAVVPADQSSFLVVGVCGACLVGMNQSVKPQLFSYFFQPATSFFAASVVATASEPSVGWDRHFTDHSVLAVVAARDGKVAVLDFQKYPHSAALHAKVCQYARICSPVPFFLLDVCVVTGNEETEVQQAALSPLEAKQVSCRYPPFSVVCAVAAEQVSRRDDVSKEEAAAEPAAAPQRTAEDAGQKRRDTDHRYHVFIVGVDCTPNSSQQGQFSAPSLRGISSQGNRDPLTLGSHAPFHGASKLMQRNAASSSRADEFAEGFRLAEEAEVPKSRQQINKSQEEHPINYVFELPPRMVLCHRTGKLFSLAHLRLSRLILVAAGTTAVCIIGNILDPQKPEIIGTATRKDVSYFSSVFPNGALLRDVANRCQVALETLGCLPARVP